MLESIFSEAVASISLENCLLTMIAALVLGALISFTHKITTKTTSNFLITLGFLPLLVQVVILLVNGNLGTSLAVAGAFTLIKFRSIQGNSKEMLSIFWAMVVGLALGMGYIIYSLIITIVMSILIILISKIVSKTKSNEERKLKITIPENLDYTEVFNDLFNNYLTKFELIKSKTTNMGSMYELTYLVKIKNGKNEKSFIDEIRCRNGNMLVMIERPEISEEVL